MERLPLDWFLEVPPVTRIWIVGIATVAIMEQCDVLSLYKLVYSYNLVWERHEYWRLVTSFLYFGQLSINLLFSVFFMARYSRMLEETFYRNRPGHYAWLLFVAMVSLVIISSLSSDLPLLGHYLSTAITYLWSRRNPDVQVSILGLFVMSAPYMPWFLALSSIIFDRSPIKGQLCGIAAGHLIFFFEDIYPSLSHGKRPLSPPWEWFRARRD